MATENALAVFSLRLPKPLADQIDQRAKVSRRARNAEIVLLLEQILDIHTQKDLRILAENRVKNTEESPAP